MFNSINGRLSEKRADTICIETGGVEWELAVPARSVDDFGRIGDEARAFTWLHHYEDGMRLYGFPSEADRAAFRELMKVEGIGPKQALRILSGIKPDALGAVSVNSRTWATMPASVSDSACSLLRRIFSSGNR